MTFGLLTEYVRLFRREQEKSRQLHQSEQRWAATLASIGDAVIATDATGRITFMNPVAEGLTGWMAHEASMVPVKEVFNIINERTHSEVECPVSKVLRHGMVVGLANHTMLVKRDGTEVPVDDSGAPIRDGDGKTMGVVLVFRDITERKQAEEAVTAAHRQVQSIIDNTTSIVYAFDLEERFLLANTAVAELLNSTPQQMIGKRRHEFMPKDDADWHESNDRQVIKTGRALEFEEHSQLKGRSITWLTTKFPLRDAQGRIYAVGGISADVSERKQMEEDLRRSRDELELRVRERTAELERKNQELQEFAFVASHDLNEPLRKIQTFGSLLEAKNADHLDEQSIDYICRMTGAADRMRELLDALLRYSRVETKGQEFKPTKLSNIAKDAADDMEVAIRKIEARVEIGQLPTVNGDPYQLRQLFQNLLANALKYHRSGVTPIIRIHGETDDGTGRIFVEDNGIGFDEKYLEKIFQPFQRLHGRNEYPGIGIGLAICRKIVERHGGTITATSTPGKGSTFIVTLPVNGTKTVTRSE